MDSLQPFAPQVRLGDLIAHRPFGLEMVTSDPPSRTLRGAHAIELPSPTRWIDSGYVVLTTGVGVRGSADRQRAFAHGVADADAAAMGFGVDVVFKQVPRPMLEAAQERSLPVFTVPYETPFGEIVRFVMASTLRHDAAQLARVVAMQDYLLTGIERPNAEQEIVDRLSSLLDARVALFSADGTVVAVARNPPVSELWELAASRRTAAPMPPRGHAIVKVIEGAGILVLVVQAATRSEAIERPAVSFAAHALQTLAAGRRLAAEDDRLARAGLLHDLLGADDVDRELIGRLRAFGFVPSGDLRVMIASANSSDGVRALCKVVEDVLSATVSTRLVDVEDGDVVATWQGEEATAALTAALAQPGAAAGVSAATASAGAFPRALAEARAALAVAKSGDEGVVEYTALGLADSLIAKLSTEQLAAAGALLEPLRGERQQMVATLISYFEHDMDVMACARALYLHPNSLRYRLAKMEKALGRSLRSPQTVADLYFALRARRLLDHSEASI